MASDLEPADGRPVLSDCEYTTFSQPLSASDVLAYYGHLRAYIQHEDGLINSRLTWSFTVHGFFFAVYGVLWSKVAELFVRLNQTYADPAQTAASQLSAPAVYQVIFLLLVAQIPIAVLGALVGWYSRTAIKAAHRAIQHLDAIAQASPAINGPTPQSRLVGPITAGIRTVLWPPDPVIQPGLQLHVRNPDTTPGQYPEEFVRVLALTQDGFLAHFEHAHPDKTAITPLATPLLPRITRGGASPSKTDSARLYYFLLPAGAIFVWIVLALLSLSAAIFAYVSRPH